MVSYNPRATGTTKTAKLRPVEDQAEYDRKYDRLFGVKCPVCKQKLDENEECRCNAPKFRHTRGQTP